MFTAPLPHDEAAETASFRKAFASAMQKADPVCSPPVQKTALVSGDSGAALVGGIISHDSSVTSVCKSLRARRRSMMHALSRLQPSNTSLADFNAIRDALVECLEHDAETIRSFGRRV